jgi:hypothetical protein
VKTSCEAARIIAHRNIISPERKPEDCLAARAGVEKNVRLM